jgi:ATP-dependent Clp protease ATP-binding subunit ClpC
VPERFTGQSQSALVLAQEECRLLGHTEVGTLHLVIALTMLADPVADVLRRDGITTEAARGQVTRMIAPHANPTDGKIPLAPEVTKTLEQSRREALRLGHDTIRPGHLLLALLDVHDGNLPVLFARLGVTPATLREDVTSSLVEPTPDAAAEPASAPADSVTPVCPRCDTAIGLRTDRLDNGLTAASCVACGAVLGVWPS